MFSKSDKHLVKDKNVDLMHAESVGVLHTAHDKKVEVKKDATPLDVIDNPSDFNFALDQAHRAGLNYIEVSDRLFEHISKDPKVDSFTYGNHGIRVFKAGTRDVILEKENKSCY